MLLVEYKHNKAKCSRLQMITSQITMLRGCFHSVNIRTVVQLPLAPSHPPLGCRGFISYTNLRYAFWVTTHL